MEDITCDICDKILEGNDKVLVLGDIPCWEDDNRRFFCCQQHADTYMWELAKQGIKKVNNAIFWDTTANDLIDDYYEYEYEQEEEEEEDE